MNSLKATSETPTRVRFIVLSALAVALAGAYLTRIMSAATTTIQKEFNLDSEQMGHVLSGFALGYFWLQIPGAWLGSRFGTRIVLSVMSVLWSIGTIWVGIANTGEDLRYARIAVGLAQAGLFPCCIKVLADWFPVGQRGIASAMLACSMQAGAILASGLTATLISTIGWRKAYLAYSGVGILWAIVFYIWFRDRPEAHRAINRAEQHLIQQSEVFSQPDESKQSRGRYSQSSRPDSNQLTMPGAGSFSSGALVAMASLLTSTNLWALCGQSVFRSFGYDFLITWFPTYLERGRGLAMVSAGMTTMVPLIGFGIGNLCGGFIVDAVLLKTNSKRLSRCGIAAGALSLCAICSLAASLVQSSVIMVLVLSLGSFFSGVASPAIWAATMDIGGKNTSIVVGIMNMTGNLGSYGCPIVLGYVFSYIEGHSTNWNLVLYLFVGIYIAAALCCLVLNPNRPAFKPPMNQFGSLQAREGRAL